MQCHRLGELGTGLSRQRLTWSMLAFLASVYLGITMQTVGSSPREQLCSRERAGGLVDLMRTLVTPVHGVVCGTPCHAHEVLNTASGSRRPQLTLASPLALSSRSWLMS